MFLKKILSISLLLILCFQFLFKAGVAGYYIANKAYITKMFCVNKSKPEMNCDGKCYLKSKMKQADDTSGKVPEGIKIKYEAPIFIANTTGITFLYQNYSCVIRCDVTSLCMPGYIRGLYHPPPGLG